MSKEIVRIKGELFWAKWMNNFNTAFNEDNNRYECTIGNIDSGDVTKLQSLGIKIKNKDSMGSFILGKSQFVFKPVDKTGQEVKIEDIGNGTKVLVDLSSYTHKMSKMHGNAPSIIKIVVTELVTYNPEPKEVELMDDVL